MLEVQFIVEGHFIESVYLLYVALQNLVGCLIFLEGLDIGGGDDFPGEIHVLQPIMIVQSFPLALQVPLKVPF